VSGLLAAAAAVARRGRRRREDGQRRGTDHVVLVAGGRGVGRLRGVGSHGRRPAAAGRAVVQRPADPVPERPAGRGFFPEAGELGAVPVERSGSVQIQVEALRAERQQQKEQKTVSMSSEVTTASGATMIISLCNIIT